MTTHPALTLANINKEITRRGYDSQAAGRAFVRLVGQDMDQLSVERRIELMLGAFDAALASHDFYTACGVNPDTKDADELGRLAFENLPPREEW